MQEEHSQQITKSSLLNTDTHTHGQDCKHEPGFVLFDLSKKRKKEKKQLKKEKKQLKKEKKTNKSKESTEIKKVTQVTSESTNLDFEIKQAPVKKLRIETFSQTNPLIAYPKDINKLQMASITDYYQGPIKHPTMISTPSTVQGFGGYQNILGCSVCSRCPSCSPTNMYTSSLISPYESIASTSSPNSSSSSSSSSSSNSSNSSSSLAVQLDLSGLSGISSVSIPVPQTTSPDELSPFEYKTSITTVLKTIGTLPEKIADENIERLSVEFFEYQPQTIQPLAVFNVPDSELKIYVSK